MRCEALSRVIGVTEREGYVADLIGARHQVQQSDRAQLQGPWVDHRDQPPEEAERLPAYLGIHPRLVPKAQTPDADAQRKKAAVSVRRVQSHPHVYPVR
jgi:hypothetical protein